MSSIMRLTCAAVLAGTGTAAMSQGASAPAPAPAATPAPSLMERLVNDPRPEAASPYGFRVPPPVIRDKLVQFGKALRLGIPREVGDGGSMGLTLPVIKPIKAGDKLVIAFWARAQKTEGGAPGKIARVRLEESMPPHRELFAQPFIVGPEWKMQQLAGVADRDYAPGTIGVAMHLAAAKQTLEIGPVFVLRYAK